MGNAVGERAIEKTVERTVEWVVLTKAPIPGLVKTRLIPTLGEQGACDVYQQLLARLAASLNDVVVYSSQSGVMDCGRCGA
jgi:glycosyltransferase A (GT-A) superfamily protein (DUF2064 family)